jgi:GTPase Era involved in 16S rRNA processing
MDSYNIEIDQIKDNINSIKQIAECYNFTGIVDKAKKFEDRLKNDKFIITVVGEFNRGKSTFINALLGVDIIPTAIRPTTATINIIHYDENPRVKVHKKNGEIIALDFSTDALKEFTSLVDFNPQSVKYVEVMYPVEYLKDGTILVDTPGVNDMDQQRLDITYGYMPISDSIIFLLDATTPFKQTEKIFLEEHVLSNNISSMFFIANKTDQLSDEQIVESIESIKKNLHSIMQTEDHSVYPLSSKAALATKLNGDQQQKPPVPFKKFEDELKGFIRGNQRAQTKIKNFKNQVLELGSLLLEDIDIEKNNITKSHEEILDLKIKIEQSAKQYSEVFNKLLKYIDEQKDALNTRIEGSLLKDFKNVKKDLLYEADLAKGDLTDYAEKIIPHKINQATKHWIEQSQPFIEQNVLGVFNKAIEGYKKHFSKAPIIRQLTSGSELAINTQIEAIEVAGQEDISNIKKASMIAGSLIMGGLSVVMSGGLILPAILPTVMGGNYGQMLIGNHFIKKKYEEQKEQILNSLPNVLSKAYDSLSLNTQKLIENKFNIFKDSLSSDFQQTFSEIKNDIQQKLDNQDAEKEDLDKKNHHLEQAIIKVNNIIK